MRASEANKAYSQFHLPGKDYFLLSLMSGFVKAESYL